MPKVVSIALCLGLLSCAPIPAMAQGSGCFEPPRPEITALSAALNSRDDTRISAAVHAIALNRRAPQAELPERFSRATGTTARAAPTAREIDALVVAYLTAAERESWWRAQNPPAPSDIPHALRMPADMTRGLIAIANAYPNHRARALSLAIDAGDYLIAASRDAGVPYTPFPLWRGRDDRLGALSQRMVARLTRCGQLRQNTRNGWFVVSEKPEEYFFDTGRAGQALSELYILTRDERYRGWIIGATAWLSAQPISANFNYNAFPASFHAAAFEATHDPAQLSRALDRLRFGVLSGMIASGSDAGQWIDAHNQRIAYRSIMLRAMIETRLAALKAPAPADAAELERLDAAIRLALDALETQMSKARGATSVASMIEVYRGLDALALRGRPIISAAPEVRANVKALAKAAVFNGRALTPDAATGIFLAALAR
jgi:hypothetical protein